MVGRTRETPRPKGRSASLGAPPDLNALEAAALAAVRKRGTRRFIVRVSLGAVLSSMLITTVLMIAIFGLSSDALVPGIAMGAVVPALVAPPIVTVIARLVARLDQTSQQLAEAAVTDPLTGVYNRRGFFEYFHRNTGDGPMSVAMVDIDEFKSINDRFGHISGDAVLRHIAAWLRERAGERGGVGRLGGDEFVIVAPAETVEQFGQRESFTCDGIEYTATVGAAAVTSAGIDLALSLADGVLYQHKAARP